MRSSTSSSAGALLPSLFLVLPAIVSAFVLPACFPSPQQRQQQQQHGKVWSRGSSSSSSSSSRRFASAAVHAATQEPVVEALASEKKPEFVVMEDGKGRSINTTMLAYLKHEGKRYCLGLPVDSPMALLDSRNKPIDPSDEVTERMFYQLDDYFTNKGYELLHSAGFLTIAGEPDWFEDEGEDEEDDDDSDDEDEYDSDEEDGDTYDVVARERESKARSADSVRVDPICDVEFEGGMYRVVQLLDKVPLSAEQTPEGKWALVSDASTHVKLDSAAAAKAT